MSGISVEQVSAHWGASKSVGILTLADQVDRNADILTYLVGKSPYFPRCKDGRTDKNRLGAILQLKGSTPNTAVYGSIDAPAPDFESAAAF